MAWPGAASAHETLTELDAQPAWQNGFSGRIDSAAGAIIEWTPRSDGDQTEDRVLRAHRRRRACLAPAN